MATECVVCEPSPMTHLAALEARPRIAAILCGPSSAMRYFNTYLVSHEVALVVLGHTLFRSLAVVEFLRRAAFTSRTLPDVTKLQLTTKPYPTLFARCTALCVSVTLRRARGKTSRT